MADTYPSAEVVATAIVAACKITGADPLAVASGARCSGGPSGDYPVSRARAYAAMALKAVWRGCGSMAIARMVGASSISCYLSNLEFQRRKGQMKWWQEPEFGRVVKAVSAICGERLREDTDGPLTMRHAPAKVFSVVTGGLMGDPVSGRSALDQKRTQS